MNSIVVPASGAAAEATLYIYDKSFGFLSDPPLSF
jgi:hypothetical protein